MESKRNISSKLMEKKQLVVIGAHDGLSGRLGERAGFDAIWASGFVVSASHGVPDANVLDMCAEFSEACIFYDGDSISVSLGCHFGCRNAVTAAHSDPNLRSAGLE